MWLDLLPVVPVYHSVHYHNAAGYNFYDNPYWAIIRANNNNGNLMA